MDTNTADLPPSYSQTINNLETFSPTTGYSVPTTQTKITSVSPPPSTGPPLQAFIHPPVVVTQQHQPLVTFNTVPVCVLCPYCQAQTVTQIKVNPRAHVIAAVLCLLCLWPCACLPYTVCFKNVHHHCGNCSKYLGTCGDTI